MSIVGDETKAYAVKIDAQTSSIGASTVRISETLAALEGKLAEAGTVEEVREILSPTVEALAKVGAELELVGKKPEVLLSKK